MHCSFTLMLSMVSVCMVLAVPLPMPVVEGDIMKAKPKFFEPKQPGLAKIGEHIVVAVSNPDSKNKVLVAPLAHSHPGNTPTMPASTYGLPVDHKKGEGSVSVGKPMVIDASKLKPVKGLENAKMHPEHLEALKAEIAKNCGSLRRRDGSSACSIKASVHTPQAPAHAAPAPPHAAAHNGKK
ncbi:hypothetical protein B0H34DRAFT_475086 [Crassisporium funariophilum]|nr:hypothetical protein B0H34DRAFT_475086 [Crassisporium funariophilum]